MSLEIKHYPQDYRTVYNPIELVMLESDATTRGYTGFAYLIDVYVDAISSSNLIGRLKVPPTTNGFGRFDLSGIMESYLSSSLGELNGTNLGPQPAAIGNYRDFKLKYGWIHYNTGTATIDMNQTVTLPDSSTDTNTSLITLNGSLPNYRRDVVNFYDWQTNNYYNKYMPTTSSFALNTKKFLTNSPNYLGTYDLNFKPTSFSDKNQKVRLTDEGYIYFLVNTDIKKINYIIKDGSSIINKSFGVNFNPATTTRVVKIPSAPATINAINPADLTSGTQPIITSTVTDYSIYLSETSVNDTMIEYFSFKLDTDCRYETRRLEFLNSLGGFDYYNFTKVSRHREDIERKFLKANPSDLTSTGAIEYSISNREKIQYYTKSSSKMKLNSDWVDAETFNWLLELIESPEVYLLDDYTTPSGTTEVRRIPIKNIEGNWEEKISSTDNIFNLSIDLEFSMDNYRQRF